MTVANLTPGTSFRFLGLIHTVESVGPAADAEMRSYGGTDVPDMSRAHQVRVVTTSPGVSFFIDRGRVLETA